MSTFNFSLNHHLELPDDVFRLLREQIYKRSGMWFSDTSKYLLQKRLSPRARELNFDSFQKYFYFLQYDPRADAEFDQIFARVEAAGIKYRSSPRGPDDLTLNTRLGGRNFYWTDKDGHIWEVLTVSYARRESGAPTGSAVS